ncbi:MAG: hypothetical protein RL885_11730 [Planctomycetota bacterium]
MKLRSISLAASLVLGTSTLFASPRQTELSYRIEYRPDPAPGALVYSLEAKGLDPTLAPMLYLENWGEWLEVEGYLSELELAPSLARQEGERFHLERPGRWDGTVRARYTIPLAAHGSPRHEAHGLLPWRLGETAFSFAHNTMMIPFQKGERVQGEITVEVVAPKGMTIFTGWGGITEGQQTVSLDHGIDQCPIAFGRDPVIAKDLEGDTPFEVIQFGRAQPIADQILAIARPFVKTVEAKLERPFGKPVRVFVTGEKPGGGGIRTDHALGVGFNPNLDPYYLSTIGHELHHEWLPGKTSGEDSIVWLFEGFNDYFALWQLARAELIDRSWFGERLLEIDAEARRSSAFGQVRLDDPSVDWRDGDGPKETLAYKGGAVLAFLLDAELQKRGKDRLFVLLKHFIDRGGYSLPAMKAWLKARDSEDLYDRYVTAVDWPEIEVVLEEQGFFSEVSETPVSMTYLGIEADGGWVPANITGIDPEGPAAKAGLRVGDRLIGFFPTRQGAYPPPKDFDSSYRYGLYLFDPSFDEFAFDVLRDGEEHRVPILPEIIDGGRQEHRHSDPKRMKAFFH